MQKFSTIDILGKCYTIVICNERSDKFRANVDTFNSRIHISEGLKQDQYGECLLHEIIETIDGECDLGMNHQTIATLSSCLYQIIKPYLKSDKLVDNKK